MRGHEYVSPGIVPGLYGCALCGRGPLSDIHQASYGPVDTDKLALIDRVADLEARIVIARDRANEYRHSLGRADIVTASTARGHLDSVLAALIEPAHPYLTKDAA